MILTNSCCCYIKNSLLWFWSKELYESLLWSWSLILLLIFDLEVLNLRISSVIELSKESVIVWLSNWDIIIDLLNEDTEIEEKISTCKWAVACLNCYIFYLKRVFSIAQFEDHERSSSFDDLVRSMSIEVNIDVSLYSLAISSIRRLVAV